MNTPNDVNTAVIGWDNVQFDKTSEEWDGGLIMSHKMLSIIVGNNGISAEILSGNQGISWRCSWDRILQINCDVDEFKRDLQPNNPLGYCKYVSTQ